MQSLVKNAADPKQVARANKAVKSQRDQELEDWRNVMLSDSGRRVVYRLLQVCGVYSEQFSADTHLTSHLLGQRSVGLLIMGDLKEASGEMYLKMLAEHIYSKEEK